LVGRDIRLRYYNGLDDFWFGEENATLHGILDSLGIAHEYVALQEGHFSVLPSMMREVFEYLDSSFVRDGSAIRRGKRGPVRRGLRDPRVGPDARPVLREQRTGHSGVIDLRGQVLRHQGLPAGVYLFAPYAFWMVSASAVSRFR
jgi:hypothetical protein